MAEPAPLWQHTAIPLEAAISRQADASLNAPFIRLWQAFLSGRILLAMALVLLQTLSQQLQNTGSSLVWLVCLGYLVLTVVLRLTASRHLPAPQAGMQWLPVIGVDIAAIFLLQILQTGALNYTALLAIPILISSALGSLLLAFGTTASITLLMLAVVSWQQAHGQGDATQAYYQTAFACAGYFCVAFLTHELAKRVRRERATALFNRLRTQTQEQVNTLVINHLSDGVLVIDSSLQVQQANPAALQLLGLPSNHSQSFSLQTYSWWEPLAEAAHASFAHARPLSVTLHLQATPQSGRTGLHVRTRITEVAAPYLDVEPGAEARHCLCVMFLHDLREMEAQLRTEKLASMGRMSAAVAHEIRNPLAAITQANALLAEDLGSQSTQQQLCRIVGQNADRLARIAEEILNIARVQQGHDAQGQALALDALLALIGQEWQNQANPPRSLLLQLNAPARHILFDEEHLRRVLINLLDNAQRHRSRADEASSLQLISGHGPDAALLPELARRDMSWFMVWSDGAPLESSVQRHLFEPFFSSQSRSSGLGLYICRELCQRYEATISYRRLARHGVDGNAFIVSLRHAPSTPMDRSLFDSIMV